MEGIIVATPAAVATYGYRSNCSRKAARLAHTACLRSSSSWWRWRTPSRALPYWRPDAKYLAVAVV